MLTQTERTRLIRLLGILGSSYVGERSAAGAMIHRLVTTAKQSWEDLLRPPWIEPPPIPDAIVERDKAAARAMARGRSWTAGLSDDEIDAMLEYRDIDSPTPEQQAAVERIMAKIRRWGG